MRGKDYKGLGFSKKILNLSDFSFEQSFRLTLFSLSKNPSQFIQQQKMVLIVISRCSSACHIYTFKKFNVKDTWIFTS